MESIIGLSLNLITQLLPQLSFLASPAVSTIVKTVATATPIVISTYKDLKPVLSRIITGLKNSGKLTEEDWNTLVEAEKAIDADFDDAANKALEEDKNI